MRKEEDRGRRERKRRKEKKGGKQEVEVEVEEEEEDGEEAKEAEKEKEKKKKKKKALFAGLDPVEPSRCASYLPRFSFMIFTLICNDRNGARELHFYSVDPRASVSSLCATLSPLLASSDRALLTGSRTHRFENNLLPTIPSGVHRLVSVRVASAHRGPIGSPSRKHWRDTMGEEGRGGERERERKEEDGTRGEEDGTRATMDSL